MVKIVRVLLILFYGNCSSYEMGLCRHFFSYRYFNTRFFLRIIFYQKKVRGVKMFTRICAKKTIYSSLPTVGFHYRIHKQIEFPYLFDAHSPHSIKNLVTVLVKQTNLLPFNGKKNIVQMCIAMNSLNFGVHIFETFKLSIFYKPSP